VLIVVVVAFFLFPDRSQGGPLAATSAWKVGGDTSMAGRLCVLCAGFLQGFAAGFRLNSLCVWVGDPHILSRPSSASRFCPKRGPQRNALQKFFFSPFKFSKKIKIKHKNNNLILINFLCTSQEVDAMFEPIKFGG
jgi:hypothetical protein